MITTQQMMGLTLLFLFIGIFAGMLIWYLFGEPKCKHEWREIINDTTVNSSGKTTGHIVVYMCIKCGKRKVTKV